MGIKIVTSTMPEIHGGRTSSILTRARIFSENGVPVTIYTTNYNADYSKVYDSFLERNLVQGQVNFENIYEYYKTKYFKKSDKKYASYIKKSFKKMTKYNKVQKVENGVEYYYDNGILKFHMSYNKETKLVKNIDLYKEEFSTSYARLYVNNLEQIHKVRYFDKENDNKITKDLFVNGNMECYLIKEYKTESLKDCRIILPKEGKVFKDEKDFFREWFEEVFEDSDYIINDARLLDKSLLDSKIKAKKIFQIHNSHLENPEDVGSSVKNSYKTLLNDKNSRKDNCIIVCLTNKQQSSIINKIPDLESRLVVIPHSKKNEEIKKSPRKNIISIVARLEKQKNIIDSLRAFKLLSHDYPEIELEIFGTGSEEQNLKKWVKENDLEKQIRFKGYAEEVNEIFQLSIFTIISSKYEGFCLVALEAVGNGCPVISYDINFGPSEIVSHKSGRITSLNTVEELYKEMKLEIENPKNRAEVLEESKRFSEEIFFEKWCSILNVR